MRKVLIIALLALMVLPSTVLAWFDASGSIYCGTLSSPGAYTPTLLSADSYKVQGVIIASACTSDSHRCYIGDANIRIGSNGSGTGYGMMLSDDYTVTLPIQNVNRIYTICTVTGDLIHWIGIPR